MKIRLRESYLKNRIENRKKLLNETVKSYKNGKDIRYETLDEEAYADIEEINNDTWHISLIISDRKGGGKELMRKIILDAKKFNIKQITLTTTEHSGWGFFDKLGFVEIENDGDELEIPMILYI